MGKASVEEAGEDGIQEPRGAITGQEAGRSAAAPARRLARALRLLVLLPFIAVILVLCLALVYRAVDPPSTLMLGRWLTGRPVERDRVPLAGIAPVLVQAVIASEDQRFCLHRGVDWEALGEVVSDEDGPSRGASTVTMQTVKNVFLWPGRSYLRKAMEIPLALLADLVWGKRRTMEIYLNVAEWGDGIYGAEAAARHWFGKGARDLTRSEAALLVVALPNPAARSPAHPSRGLRALAGRLQARLARIGSLAACVRP
ncbi:transglycosylase domain-containing protein [Methylobacterium sp. WSM2598]|uniref:transglycosylase domain-containing protein n=1 Tax=Methylobacterium sp. WSM2598 TaxID=398261 RepID=UPI0003633A8B|nr:transglycosylase domain-containing protein [Methylobacterium sp. WSM2598]